MAFLLLSALLCGLAAAGDKKQLVIFAGPHRSGSASVEEFFQKYCKGAIRHDPDSFPLRYWKWPEVSQEHAEPGVPPYKIFQRLVMEPNLKDPLNQDIMAGIKEAYDTTQDGIVMGTEMFDQMGPYAQYDGLAAMIRIVESLGLTDDPSKITVVVNYRAPRFGHWESVWKGSVEGTDRTYEDFMCHTRQYHEKMELLSTAANPLQVALESQKLGWNVALMDMQAIDQLNRDVSHTIACSVMSAKCQENEGWVNHHFDEAIHNNEAEDGHDIIELTDEDRVKAEELLLARDCAYSIMMKELKAKGIGNVQVYPDRSLWKQCDTKLGNTTFKNLLNPELLFRGLLAQLNCPKELDDMPRSIDDVLSGKFTLGGDYGNFTMGEDNYSSNQPHHWFFWLLALVVFYVGMSIYKNNGRVPAAWITAALKIRQNTLELITGGRHRVSNIQLESMDVFSSGTSLSGRVS